MALSLPRNMLLLLLLPVLLALATARLSDGVNEPPTATLAPTTPNVPDYDTSHQRWTVAIPTPTRLDGVDELPKFIPAPTASDLPDYDPSHQRWIEVLAPELPQFPSAFPGYDPSHQRWGDDPSSPPGATSVPE